MKIAVTGHRPRLLKGLKDVVRDDMQNFLSAYDREDAQVISGMALGVDQWWAEIALDLGLPVIAAIPFPDFDVHWPEKERSTYRSIMESCDEIHIISGPGYSRWKYMERNRWMVDQCDQLVAYYRLGEPGGTAHTIEYAEQVGKPIRRVELNGKL